MKKYAMQLIFGLPIMLFAMLMMVFDTMGKINIEPIGYAFFGGIITLLLNYFFRKSPPETEGKK